MEKHGSKKMKNSNTTPLCIPRFRSNKNTRPSPMTLLERLRETVFRLIMLSALSKSSHHVAGPSPDMRPRKYCPVDAHQSEAVADCIEFIKKKALTEENRDSTASSTTVDGTEMVVPVGVVV